LPVIKKASHHKLRSAKTIGEQNWLQIPFKIIPDYRSRTWSRI